MTSEILLEKLSEFKELLSDFGNKNRQGKFLWDLKSEIFEDFKSIRFEAKEERQKAWEIFQSCISSLKEKQQDINRENQEFAERAINKLDDIDRAIPIPGLFGGGMDKDEINLAKNDLENLFQFLKNKQWPSKEKKDWAWQKFKDIKHRLRQREDEFYAKKREKYNSKLEHSEELTEKIMKALNACDPDTPVDDLMAMMEKLITFIVTFGLASIIETLFGIEEKPKSPLRMKSDALKDVYKLIQENSKELTKNDKNKIFTEYRRVKNALDQAWADHKEEIRIKNEEWSERQREKAEKKRLWERKQWEFIEMLEEKTTKKKDQKDNLYRIVEKQRDFLEKLDSRLNSQNEYLEKVKSQLDDLENKYDDARSDSFRDKVSSWIDQKKEKIEQVETSIDEIESKKNDVEKNISELESKIDQIESAITDMQQKISEAKQKINVD